jgi:hypothetical protein
MRAAIISLYSTIRHSVGAVHHAAAWERAGLADLERHDIVPWLFC